MSSTWMDVPTFQMSENDLQNLLGFIYKHERLLKEFGAIKIRPNVECKLALKKRRKDLALFPTTNQIVKTGRDELIYSVQKVDSIGESTQQHISVTDESSFWSFLSGFRNERQQLNISVAPGESFFSQKKPREHFDIHRLSKESLLKLGGCQVTRQFTPCIRRAHASGAIFPLASARQRLFSINYHHEGGSHHWYIIPAREREVLRRIIDQQNSSGCLEHGQLLIDPSVLDKNHIRYQRIIQHPNEFVVLSAGTLAQSFTEGANWSESIDFALPSWIEEGHASVSPPPCQCDIPLDSSSETIDVTLFGHTLIQRYITSHLNIITDDTPLTSTDYNDMDMITITTSNNSGTSSSNAATMVSKNMKDTIPVQSIVPSFQSPTISLIVSPTSSYSPEKDNNKFGENNVQVQYELLEEGSFPSASDWKTPGITLIDPISSEHLSETNARTNQLYQTTTTPVNIHQDATNSCDINNYFLQFEELMDSLPSTTGSIDSTYIEANQSVNTNGLSILSSNTRSTAANKKSNINGKRIFHQTVNWRRTLYVSGLRNYVNTNDIRKHFNGCIKVTVKRYRTTPHLKYAFVLHRTPREAEYNLQRPIDFRLLGPECRVEYASDRSAVTSNQQSLNNKKVAVRQIPENVNENDLRQLFANCRIIKYCPALCVHDTATATKTENNSNILSGYAVILFDDEQKAAHAIEHADQYRINGQSLVISFYCNKKSPYATAKELFTN